MCGGQDTEPAIQDTSGCKEPMDGRSFFRGLVTLVSPLIKKRYTNMSGKKNFQGGKSRRDRERCRNCIGYQLTAN